MTFVQHGLIMKLIVFKSFTKILLKLLDLFFKFFFIGMKINLFKKKVG